MKMEITAVDTARIGGSAASIRISTDEGVTGYGEAVVETAPEPVFKVIEKVADRYLVGTDPTPIERHRRQLQDAVWYHDGPVMNSAFSGIEHALWDIKGKALGVPVYELLGGPVREKVRVYKWIGETTRENLPQQARARVSEGLTAMKFCPTPNEPSRYPRIVDEVRETVGEVREAVGPDIDLMLDPASRWKLAEARHVLSELEAFDPLFAEDFISPYHVQAVEKLADSTTIPYALGDRLYRLREFEEVIHRDAAAVLQPDISHSGGILEIKKIAAAAEHHGMRIAPHNPLGPVALAAALHVDLSVPNFLIQEIAHIGLDESGDAGFGSWALAEYIDTDVLEIEDGFITAPERPGLGVEIDDEVFEKQPPVPEAPLFFDRSNFHVPEW
jgi:galactonate dehydratase